ncbi:MAG TPA: RNA polymerase sigma factor [Thermoanaerobaculia bacterium]
MDDDTGSGLIPVKGEPSPPGPRHELFAELALPVLDDLYRLACRLERDPDRARDLLQEALLVGLRKLHQLKAHGSFRAWAARIVRGVFLNSRRGPREEPLGERDLSGSVWPEEPPLGPEERFLARRRAAAIASALDELPREQRVAILLVDLQGFTYAEAAAALEAPPGTVASWVVRGRHALRRRLRPILEGARDDD